MTIKLKEQNIEKINSIMIISLAVIYLLSYSFNIFYGIIESYSIYITTLFLFSFFLLNYKKIISQNKKMIYLLLTDIVILILCVIFKSTGMGSVLQMLGLLIMLLQIPHININKKCLDILKIIVGICFFIYFISNKNHLNPNHAGYIYFCYYLFFIIMLEFKSKISKVIYILFTIFITWCIIVTECRTALLGLVLVNILMVLPKKIYSNSNFQKMLVPLLTFGNFAFASFYVMLWKNKVKLNLFGFINKNLYSGRNRIWNEVFTLIGENPILGVGSNYKLNNHFAYALHNSVLMITLTFGIPNFIIFFIFLWNFIKKIIEKSIDLINRKKIYIVVISIFVIDFFESYLYWSRFNILFFILIIYLLNKCRIKKENEDKSEEKQIYFFEEGVDRMGGVERIISTLSNELIEKYKVNVISFYKTREKPFFKYNEGINIDYLSVRKRKIEKRYSRNKLWYYIIRCMEKIKDNTYLEYKIIKKVENINKEDVVVFGRTDVAIKVLPYIDKCKKVIVRDAIHLEYQKKAIKDKIKKLFPGKVDLLIVSSDESLKLYKEQIKCNTKKIYNPLGIIPIQKSNFDSKTIISVGRYSFQKGFENLIKAYSYVQREYPDWKLKIVGNNNESNNLKEMIKKLDLEDKVILEDNSNNIVEHLNNSSIFVMTSRYEGYANALVEAMACGVPSISYNWLLGANEIIKDKENGTLIELVDRYGYAKGIDNEQDIKNLANAILELINNKELYNKYAKNSSEIIKTRNTELIISKWIEEIEN